MKNLLRWAGAIALALPSVALAQSVGSSVVFPSGWAPGQSICVRQADLTCIPVSTSTPLPTIAASGIQATQLPASTGPKAGAASLSVVPNTDTPFPFAYNDGTATPRPAGGDTNGNLYVTPRFGAFPASGFADSADSVGVASTSTPALKVLARLTCFNGTAWDRCRGDLAGAWMHAPPATVSSALSGSITTSGGTAAIALTNATRTEIINPSAAALWASYGTPAVNGAGSFKIAPDGTYTVDRAAGTLTLLSTAAAQPYTINRFTF